MTSEHEFQAVIRGLLATVNAASAIADVPAEFLVVALLTALKWEEEPNKQPKHDEPTPGLMPASERFESFLKLIERDNPALYTKITGHD